MVRNVQEPEGVRDFRDPEERIAEEIVARRRVSGILRVVQGLLFLTASFLGMSAIFVCNRHPEQAEAARATFVVSLLLGFLWFVCGRLRRFQDGRIASLRKEREALVPHRTGRASPTPDDRFRRRPR